MSKATVKATTERYPEARMEWECEIPEDNIQDVLLYNNLMFDIVGMALAKLGVEYSKYFAEGADDNARKRLNERMEPVIEALKSEA